MSYLRSKLFLPLFLVFIFLGYGYFIFLMGNVSASKDGFMYIRSNWTYQDVVNYLKTENILSSETSFRQAASVLGYGSKIRSGKFRLYAGMNNFNLVSMLKSGKQTPVKLILHNKRTKEQLAGFIGDLIEADSTALLHFFNDRNALQKYNYTPETVMAAFIPNTYETFWNNSPSDLFEKMLKENNKFWTSDRLEKAKNIGLTPTQVYTLASIVETETRYAPEKPRVAGVYLNRLRENWKLQADPTVVFAVGDFTMRQVFKKHLETDSPYNTYMYTGLPPGPIYMSSIESIDATLNAEKHDYMYFCANPDRPGSHSFAHDLNGHNQNKAKYLKWLEQDLKKKKTN